MGAGGAAQEALRDEEAEYDEGRRAEIRARDGPVRDQVGVERGEGDGHRAAAPSPEIAAPARERRQQQHAQQRLHQPRGQEPAGGRGVGIEQLLRHLEQGEALRSVRLRRDGVPGGERGRIGQGAQRQERQRDPELDQRRMFLYQAIVARAQDRVPAGDVQALVDGEGVGAGAPRRQQEIDQQGEQPQPAGGSR